MGEFARSGWILSPILIAAQHGVEGKAIGESHYSKACFRRAVGSLLTTPKFPLDRFI